MEGEKRYFDKIEELLCGLVGGKDSDHDTWLHISDLTGNFYSGWRSGNSH